MPTMLDWSGVPDRQTQSTAGGDGRTGSLPILTGLKFLNTTSSTRLTRNSLSITPDSFLVQWFGMGLVIFFPLLTRWKTWARFGWTPLISAEVIRRRNLTGAS